MTRKSRSRLKTYRLIFKAQALKEWNKLGSPVRAQFEKKLKERLTTPRVVSARLSELPNCYKIKLRKVGYRLIYRVDDDRIVIIVIAIGRRERNEAYETAARRLG